MFYDKIRDDQSGDVLLQEHFYFVTGYYKLSEILKQASSSYLSI